MPPIEDIEDGRSHAERVSFFDAVYHRANGDQKNVPWTTEDAKPEVLDWLAAHPAADNARAIDIACGLGENAEALVSAGYNTTAFDVSETAISWAKQRFPDSKVAYHQADLFDLPEQWGQFDLVHECYTVQSLPEELRADAFGAIAQLVAPGGRLLVYARIRPDGSPWEDAPWPVMPSEFNAFETAGLTLISNDEFEAPSHRGDMISHTFRVYHRPQ